MSVVHCTLIGMKKMQIGQYSKSVLQKRIMVVHFTVAGMHISIKPCLSSVNPD